MGERISVVIPTIEEKSIFALIDKIRQLLGSDIQVVIVDKSSDGYRQELEKTGSKVIRQADQGVARAIMLGLRGADGDILASIDADATHDPQGLVEAVGLIKAGKADFVLGNRLNRLHAGSMSQYLRFGNASLSMIFNTIYKTDVHDVTTGLFAMKKEVFEAMRNIEPDKTGTAFFAAEAAKKGYRVAEVDINYYVRKFGPSKLTKSKLIWGLRAAWLFLAHSKN